MLSREQTRFSDTENSLYCFTSNLKSLTQSDTLLGKHIVQSETYAPEILRTIDREQARAAINPKLIDFPFSGVDRWYCFELTWLQQNHQPRCAELVIAIDSQSERVVESKSLKLYLNSLAFTTFNDDADVTTTLRNDLEGSLDTSIEIELHHRRQDRLPTRKGFKNLDEAAVSWDFDPTSFSGSDASLLRFDSEEHTAQKLQTDVFYCNCPVTGQPDHATIFIAYTGPKIDEAALLAYIVSYRRSRMFHETAIEKITMDIATQTKPFQLSVSGHFARRGGISIHPTRSFTSRD